MKNRLQQVQQSEPVTHNHPPVLMKNASEAEANEILATDPNAEKLTIVVHKATGRARWLAWIDSKWVPIGPDYTDKRSAEIMLEAYANLASKIQRSLIKTSQKADRHYLSLGKKLSAIPDAEWVASFVPDGSVQQSNS